MLTVITGPMFAGKSTELQRQGERLGHADGRVLFVKPDNDNRYSENEIVTHDGKRVPCINVSMDNPVEIFKADLKYIDAILIDEIQFFDSSMFDVIQELLLEGYTVVVAGLDMDYLGLPFKLTALLMACAEEVVKLTAVCKKCRYVGWVSARISSDTSRVSLGTEKEYMPLCRKCFEKHIQEGEI